MTADSATIHPYYDASWRQRVVTMTGELEHLGHYIGGRRVAGASGRSAPVFNPALGVATTQVALASATETRSAIAAARAALPEWSDTPALRRARVLFRFRDLIEQHADEIAGILTREHGKVLADARGEVTRGIEIVEFACGIPHLLKGEFSDSGRARHRQLVAAPAGRRLRRHHALQFPGDGADVDVPDRHRLRQHLRAEAFGEGSGLPAAARGAVHRGRCRRRAC